MTVTTITSKPKAVRFSATMGQFRTLKNLDLTVALTAKPSEIKKILALVTACHAGGSLQISAQIVQPKPVQKDAKEENHKSRNKQRRRWNNTYRTK